MAAHQVVPALLGVEHRRPQLTSGGDTGLFEGGVRHLGLDVAERLEPHRRREPTGGVDGEHEHLATEVDRRLRGGGGGGRRLADAPGAAVDDDLLGREQLLERAHAVGGSAGRHQ